MTLLPLMKYESHQANLCLRAFLMITLYTITCILTGKLSNIILHTFSRANVRIEKRVPTSNGLSEEAVPTIMYMITAILGFHSVNPVHDTLCKVHIIIPKRREEKNKTRKNKDKQNSCHASLIVLNSYYDVDAICRELYFGN